MKMLYFGTVCNLENYEKLLADCKEKPTIATIVFESALLDGFKKNGIDIEIHSFPMIPTFPTSKLLIWGEHEEELDCGYICKWLSTINLPFVKQFSRRICAKRVMKSWISENGKDGAIFTYSIPPFLVKDIIKYGRQNSVKTIAIIPDLLRDMYINSNPNSVITRIKQLYLKPALKLQGEYDGYVYLTEAMRDVVAPNKPYIVMEGIANTENIEIREVKKNNSRAIMYAGMLHKKYGVINLLDAFEQLEMKDLELWLFGEGTAVEEIQERSKNNPNIRYFGRKDRYEILSYERKATLLINPRNVEDEYTKYSFPSKTIEYMLSGTPLITTRLEGIPKSYFEYMFVIEDNKTISLKKTIEEALAMSEKELNQLGERARDYVMREKDSVNQTKKILEFIGGIKCQ